MANQKELDLLLSTIDGFKQQLSEDAEHLGNITISDFTDRLLVFGGDIKDRVSEAKHTGELRGGGYVSSPLIVEKPAPVKEKTAAEKHAVVEKEPEPETAPVTHPIVPDVEDGPPFTVQHPEHDQSAVSSSLPFPHGPLHPTPVSDPPKTATKDSKQK
jgi:hypothetical protein